jgi:hypothetical protein
MFRQVRRNPVSAGQGILKKKNTGEIQPEVLPFFTRWSRLSFRSMPDMVNPIRKREGLFHAGK